MAQFDVYKNPSKATSLAYPYILDIQNSLFSDMATRMVVPLADYSVMKKEELDGLTPKVSYKGKNLLVLVPQIASMNVKMLQNPIGSLAHLRDEIISAIDFAITGF